MKNRPIFNKLKAFIDRTSYTIEQVQNVTSTQVGVLLDLTYEELKEYRRYKRAIKRLILEQLQAQEDSDTVGEMLTDIHMAIVSRFPDYVPSMDLRDKNNRKVTLNLDDLK